MTPNFSEEQLDLKQVLGVYRNDTYIMFALQKVFSADVVHKLLVSLVSCIHAFLPCLWQTHNGL